jgi:DNA-binding response OmpR family regulator
MEKFKVLVIDDEPEIVKIISIVLEKEEYNVLAAFNGQTGFKILSESNPDLVLMDWEMPVMNGIETLKKIKSEPQFQNTPVIMITGRMTSIENLKTAYQAGAIDFIRKPIESVELVARVKSMLMLADYYKQSIKQKDWELTFISKDLQQSFSLNHRIISPLEIVYSTLKNENHPEAERLNSVIRQLKSSEKNQSWDDFQTQFKRVHPEFSKNLLNAFPTISPEEVKLCHLLRLNLNSKEIAAITFKNAQSIDIARYRLRKKFNLEKDENLIAFLSKF